MSQQIREFNVGDLLTPLRVQFRNNDLTVLDISTYTVTFSMFLISDSSTKVDDQTCVQTNSGTDGRAQYNWVTADIDTEASFWGYFTLTKSGKTAQYPQTGRDLLIVFHSVP